MILNNRWITIRDVPVDVGISFFTNVLGKKSAAAKICPKLLNFQQKQSRMDIIQEMLTTSNDDPDLLKKVITRDESWMYGDGIETKA